MIHIIKNIRKYLLAKANDSLELSEETLKRIKQSEKDLKEGKTISLEQVKKNLKL